MQNGYKWFKITNCEPKQGEQIEVIIKHCNKDLNLPKRKVKGYMGDDNFYLSDGSELSWNWDIICWRYFNER